MTTTILLQPINFLEIAWRGLTVDTASVKPSPQRGDEEINNFSITLMESFDQIIAPCAVYNVTSRRSPSDYSWNQQMPIRLDQRVYFGYLMNLLLQPCPSKWICVRRRRCRGCARKPQWRKYANGDLPYVVEGNCGYVALPCKPYIDGYELTCVVCTK